MLNRNKLEQKKDLSCNLIFPDLDTFLAFGPWDRSSFYAFQYPSCQRKSFLMNLMYLTLP